MSLASVDLSDVLFLVAGCAAILAARLPRLLSGLPFSLPIAFLLGGYGLYQLPVDLPDPDPVAHSLVAEHLTEVVVIVALMGTGLAIDRAPGLRAWSPTWRVLGIVMPLTIAGTTVLGVWGLGWSLAASLLLGSILAPTDPVLASDVQVARPGVSSENEHVRFTLTSEAGLNDGLAFPFVHAAVAAASVAGAGWIAHWALIDVGYRLAVAVVLGAAVGKLLGWWMFRGGITGTWRAEYTHGFVAIAATFLTYGITQMTGGYGFVAVFVAAVTLRATEPTHGQHRVLYGFTAQVERLLTAGLLLLLGGAIAGGVLDALTWRLVVLGLAVLLVIRPACGMFGQLGSRAGWRERMVIAFFGIRGIGSFFYAAYVVVETDIPIPVDELWAVVCFVVLVSVVMHGITATPVMNRLDRYFRHDRPEG